MSFRTLRNHGKAFSLPFTLVFFVFPIVLFGQIETGVIQGTVTDASGASIPGADVRFIQVATGLDRAVQTDAQGFFRSTPLRIGEYRVEVEADGFKKALTSNLILQLEQVIVLNVTMQLGAVTESVDVTAAAPLLETTQATQGQVIDNKRIVDMPLNGRDYIQLALLSAGAVQPIGGRYGGFSAGGQRTSQNNYMLDGFDNNNLQIAGQGRRAEVVKPQVDSIQEFKISTNAYSAESGRALGGTINVSLKSGTNEFHGTAYHFLRNEKMDAKNFFDPADQPRAPFKRNQFGFSVGGPIIRNRTFFFGDWENTLIRESGTYNNTVPTVAQRQGNFSGVPQLIYDPATYDAGTNMRTPFANNIIPTNRIDQVAARAQDWYPAPNREGLANNFLFNSPRPEDNRRWNIKVDHTFSDRDNVFFRYSKNFDDVGNSPAIPSTLDGNSTFFNHFGYNTGLSWNHIFTPSLVTTFKLGWNRIYTERLPVLGENQNSAIGLSGLNQVLAGAPLFNISGMRNIGGSNYTPNLIDSQNRQLLINTSWTHGSHTVKFGYQLQFLQSYLTNPQQELGQLVFNGNFTRQVVSIPDRGGRPFADFMLGIPFRTDLSNSVYMNLRSPWQHAYIQDDWRVTNRLTLNLGLRYERSLPWTEKDDLISNFDIDSDPANPRFLIAGQAGLDGRFNRALIENKNSNFGPRFGFAFRAFDDTVVRGGYGVFFGNLEPTGGGQFLETNPPFHIKTQITTDSITPTVIMQDGVPQGLLTPDRATGLSFSSFEVSPKWPTSQQWNFNIQQSFGQGMVWEIGYYGTKSNHLVNRLDGNYALPGPGNINNRRRYTSIVYPGTNTVVGPLASMNRHEFNGNSLYHSLQTRFERRFRNGFTFLGSYIWSKTIGDVGGFAATGSAPNSGIQNPLDRKAERSLDNQHRSHVFTASYVYELPFGRGRMFGNNWNGAVNGLLGGWAVAGIHSITSGRPFGLSVRGNPANTGNLNRPNVVPGVDPVLPSDQRDPQRWFNTNAFVPNNDFEFGNAGRNILIGPGTFNWDFAVYKQIIITERVNMQFRAEAFNVTNTPNFGFPNSEVGNVNFGVITGAGRPRNLQLGLKLLF